GGLVLSSVVFGHTLISRTLNNAGLATWLGGDIRLDSGAVFHNLPGGTLDARSDNSIGYSSGIGPVTIINDGTFTKSAGAGTTSLPGPLTFSTSGTINVNSGSIRIGGAQAVASTGLLDIQGGAVNASGTI